MDNYTALRILVRQRDVREYGERYVELREEKHQWMYWKFMMHVMFAITFVICTMPMQVFWIW